MIMAFLDDDGRITEENVSEKQVWSIQNRRVMVDFNRRGQPIKDSRGLLGSWLGSLCYDFNMLPINYTDWRKLSVYRKELAWNAIKNRFWFDDPIKRKKYVLSALGSHCKDVKQRLWRNTPREALAEKPPLIPQEQWTDFVLNQFTDKTKGSKERGVKNRSKLKITHALGRKSLAMKADEMEEESGVEPTRGELFIASRTKSDGSMVSEEATIFAAKVKEAMEVKETGESSSSNDAISQVFGPEHPGRVRFIGRGPTPSAYYSSFGQVQVQNDEIVEIKSKLQVQNEEMVWMKSKLDIVASALHKMIMINENQHFQAGTSVSNAQVNENGGNIKLASALQVLIESCKVNDDINLSNILHQASLIL